MKSIKHILSEIEKEDMPTGLKIKDILIGERSHNIYLSEQITYISDVVLDKEEYLEDAETHILFTQNHRNYKLILRTLLNHSTTGVSYSIGEAYSIQVSQWDFKTRFENEIDFHDSFIDPEDVSQAIRKLEVLMDKEWFKEFDVNAIEYGDTLTRFISENPTEHLLSCVKQSQPRKNK